MIIHNGILKPHGACLFSSENRAIRFGEGLFETMYYDRGEIRFEAWHFERLKAGLELLGLHGLPSFPELKAQCLKLAVVNNHQPARIRLTVTGGAGGLFQDPPADYIIETWPAEIPAAAISVVTYRDFPIAPGNFSHLKHNNFLPYALAAKFALEKKADESVMLNTSGRICEGTVSNIFLVKDEKVFTPPLEEGCVAGIYRRHLLHQLPLAGIPVTEKPVTEHDLLDADELFLTNAIRGISPVMNVDGRSFPVNFTRQAVIPAS